MKNHISQALDTFRLAAKSVQAYKQLLRSLNINPDKIITGEQFKSLPILDKINFIKKFPLSHLVPHGVFPSVAYASSGSSGKAFFWFRNSTQEKNAADAHEIIVQKIYNIPKNDPTLVIICFSMGVWVAGNSESKAFQSLNKRGFNITTITPGIEKNDILAILREVAPYYKHVILAGYPPFISHLLDTCKKMNIPTRNNIHILTSGDSFTEEWRDSVMKMLNHSKPHHVLNIYGCADAGMLGYETPLSIYIRRIASSKPKLFAQLFGKMKEVPVFMQYNPKHIYFENENNELLLTTNAGIPLIRYNLHDIGTAFSHDIIKEILTKNLLGGEADQHGLNVWKMPFVLKQGRTDVAVTFYSLNIYPEHLVAGIKDKRITKLFSGNFFSYNKNGRNHTTHTLHMVIELADGVTAEKKIVEQTTHIITEHLIKLNTEYNKLYRTIGNKALPIIHLKMYGKLGKTTSGLAQQIGKKPRIIL